MLKSVYLAPDEANILDVASRVRFGELNNVEIRSSKQTTLKQVTPVQEKFIALIRSEGIAFLHKVIVHNGEPALVEVYGREREIDYIRKLKVA